MSIERSTRFQDEFAVTTQDGRGAALLASFRPRRYSGVPHLTKAKARKLELLYRHGFTAVVSETRQCYQRGAGRLLTLDHAMMCVEVMA